MPSLLRWRAANQLHALARGLVDVAGARRYAEIAQRIQRSIVPVFYQPVDQDAGLLVSATGSGKKDDIWASAFAVWLRILPRDVENKVVNHLEQLYEEGEVVKDGQVREIPLSGPLGGHWNTEKSARDDAYQDGGYWATPTGWYVTALRRRYPKSADKMLSEYVAYVRQHRAEGAPFEWINPATGAGHNANYASSAGLVFISLTAGH